MVVITGDVHHMSMNGSDQRHMSESEPELARRYVDILAKADLKVTLFVTGKAAKEEPGVFRDLMTTDAVEIGGHTYSAFQPRWLYSWLFGRAFGTRWGPRAFQNWEIQRTRGVFQSVLGIDIHSWRDHGYYRDRHTYRLLAENGIKVVSDEAGPDLVAPFGLEEGVCCLPINTLPDHDHVVHGDQRPIPGQPRNLNTAFTTGLVAPKDWVRIVQRQVNEIVKKGGVATLLLHPGCMAILDDFATLKELSVFLKQFECVTALEACQRVNAADE